MKWQNRRRSSNVEDRRGRPARAGVALGGGGMLIVLIVALLFGVDPTALLQDPGGAQLGNTPFETAPVGEGVDDEMRAFVSVILGDTETVWSAIFRDLGRTYQEPGLVLFTDEVRSACGFASAAMGPFYCPADSKAYLDFSFFQDLAQRFQAPGDFAQAYVIAHEIGHHVQNQLGISDAVQQQRSRLSETEYNALSVRLELQADFFAGVWAHHAQANWSILEPGDLEEALRAASAIGDDRLQRQSTGRVVPDSFTHGTSEQRVRWFRRGFDTGDVTQGDTFNARSL